MEPTDLKLRFSKEDQEFFAQAILNPAAPVPALVAAFRRRAEILNKVASGVEDMLDGRVTPHDVAMEKISASLNDADPGTVIETDEDFDNLCRDMGVDPNGLDEDGIDWHEAFAEYQLYVQALKDALASARIFVSMDTLPENVPDAGQRQGAIDLLRIINRLIP